VSAPKYGPDETWPAHDKKYWHEPLAEAHRAGWTLTYIDAPHRFGVVSCPSGQHTFEVDKTATGAETKAREARKRIRACGHPPKGPVRNLQGRSVEQLNVAEQLTTDAEHGLARAETRQDAQEALDRLEVQLDTAACTVEDVLLAEQELALEAAIEVDDAPDPPALVEELNQATAAVDRSESAAKSVKETHPGVAKPLLERAKSLRGRIGESRSRLAALQERRHSNSS
jgi:hypothetical protein